MSAIEQAAKLHSKLTPGEKAQLLQWVARDLGDACPGIESVPDVCGGEPCIVRTRVPVWLLENAKRLGTSESELLRCYPTLHAEDLANAWHTTSERIVRRSTNRFRIASTHEPWRINRSSE